MMYSPSTLLIGLITPALGTDVLRLAFCFASFLLSFSPVFCVVCTYLCLYTTCYLHVVYGDVHFRVSRHRILLLHISWFWVAQTHLRWDWAKMTLTRARATRKDVTHALQTNTFISYPSAMEANVPGAIYLTSEAIRSGACGEIRLSPWANGRRNPGNLIYGDLISFILFSVVLCYIS